MRQYRVPLSGPDTFFAVRSWADCIINMSGFDLRHARACALADSPQISEQTKARVRALAATLGYVVHSAARSMRRGQSTLIGLIIPDVQNEFYGTLAKALAQCCELAGFQLLLAITEDDADSEERQVRGLSEARGAGIVIVPCPRPRKETLMLLARGPWVQLIRRIQGVDAPWFGIDDEAALRDATTHLLSLGHRRIAYIGGTLELSTGRDRLKGFESAFTAVGLPVPQHLIHLGRPRMDFAASAFASLWQDSERPSAVVTGGARLSAGVIEMMGLLKLHAPQNVSIVTYGDVPNCPVSACRYERSRCPAANSCCAASGKIGAPAKRRRSPSIRRCTALPSSCAPARRLRCELFRSKRISISGINQDDGLISRAACGHGPLPTSIHCRAD